MDMERAPASAALIDLFGAINQGIVYVLDLEQGRVELVTGETLTILGHPREAFEGMALDMSGSQGAFLLSLVHDDDVAAVREHVAGLRQACRHGVSTLLCRWKSADGEWRWIDSRARALSLDEHGDVRSVMGVAVDVTAQYEPDPRERSDLLTLLLVEEAERERIARELHDSTAQYLVAIALCAARVRNFEGARQARGAVAQQAIEEVSGLLQALQQELHVSVFAMHPPELERSGLAHVLADLAAGFDRRTRVRTRFEIVGQAFSLSSTAEHALLRISQEALLNIHKHARAHAACIRLQFLGEEVRLEIEDDGAGAADPRSDGGVGGMGLLNMTERIAALGGTLSVVARRGGFLVSASIAAAAHRRQAHVQGEVVAG